MEGENRAPLENKGAAPGPRIPHMKTTLEIIKAGETRRCGDQMTMGGAARMTDRHEGHPQSKSRSLTAIREKRAYHPNTRDFCIARGFARAERRVGPGTGFGMTARGGRRWRRAYLSDLGLLPVTESSSAGLPRSFMYSMACDGTQRCSSVNGMAASLGSSWPRDQRRAPLAMMKDWV